MNNPKDTKEAKLTKDFDAAFKEHFHKIRFIAYTFLKEMEDAENVAQDVFISLWEKRKRVDFEKGVYHWLVTITRNKCLNILKSNKVQQKYLERNYNYAVDLMKDLTYSSTEFLLLNNEADKLLASSLNKMSDSIRETFLLCRFNGKKYEEAAKIQNVSIKTIEYRIMVALRILRKELGEYLVFLLVQIAIKLFII